MIQKLNKWLQDSKRDYAEGVAMFQQLGSQAQKDNFLSYLQSGTEVEGMGRYDARFTMLINQLAAVRRRLQTNPELLAKAKKLTGSDSLLKSGKSKSDNINPDKPRLDIDDLPEELLPLRERLKDLVPLMAKVHAEMSDEKIADDKRAILRTDLINLDDERRSIWTKIDQYVKDGTIQSIDKSTEEKQVEQNMLQLGADIQREISNVRGNITRNTNAVAKYAKSGDKEKEAKAQQRLDSYKARLTELEKLVNDDD